MKRSHRLVVAFAALLGVAAPVLAVATPAQAYTPLTCQTRTHTLDSAPAENMSYWPYRSLDGWWKWGRYYVSQCRHGVRWDPNGWRYTPQGNVQLRIRTYNSNGNTWYVTDWVTAIGSGSTVTVAGFVQPGTWFSVEGRVLGMTTDEASHPWDWWFKGQIEF